MVDPRVIFIVASIAVSIWIGGETVKGLRWVKHHIQTVAHHIVHPHQTETK